MCRVLGLPPLLAGLMLLGLLPGTAVRNPQALRAQVVEERSPASAAPSPSVNLQATVYGAAGEVSGSLTILQTGRGRWMIDCGAVYPGGPGTAQQRIGRAEQATAQLPAAARQIDGLLITHAHLDHLGRVPLLVDSGFAGPIYLTQITADLADVMLAMQVRFDRERIRAWTWSKRSLEQAGNSKRALLVHWQACPYRQSMSLENAETVRCSQRELQARFEAPPQGIKISLCRACADEEAARVRRQYRIVPYGRPVALAPGVQATFFDAGHIPGSASILLEVQGTPSRRVLFSGDLGNPLSALFCGPQPGPRADAVFIEATYGAARREPAVAHQREEFRKALGTAVAEHGVVWVPAFALDRTQKILYEIRLAQQQGLLRAALPVYCPSPSAMAVTGIYQRHRSSGCFRPEVATEETPWQVPGLRKTVPSYLPRPCILISPSDMTVSQWSQRLLDKQLPQASTSVFLVGYQDPLGEAGLLKAGARELQVAGRTIPVAATIRDWSCFTGHGDAADIDAWLANQEPRASTVILMHGEPEELQARAAELRRRWARVIVASSGEPIALNDLKPGRCAEPEPAATPAARTTVR